MDFIDNNYLENISNGVMLEVTEGFDIFDPMSFVTTMRKLKLYEIPRVPFLIMDDGRIFLLLSRTSQSHENLVELISLEYDINSNKVERHIKGAGALITDASKFELDHDTDWIKVKVKENSYAYYEIEIHSSEFGGIITSANDLRFLMQNNYTTLHFMGKDYENKY